METINPLAQVSVGCSQEQAWELSRSTACQTANGSQERDGAKSLIQFELNFN